MIIHKKTFVKLSDEQSLSFIKANYALEGLYLTAVDIKNSLKIVSGQSKADDVIEKIILRKGLRRSASSI